QSVLVVQASVGSSTQKPVVVSHVGVQVEKPSLPHVERAAHRTTLPLQFVGTPAAFTACATQLTNCPGFFALAQEASAAACTDHVAASQAGGSALLRAAGIVSHAPTRKTPTSALRMGDLLLRYRVHALYCSSRRILNPLSRKEQPGSGSALREGGNSHPVESDVNPPTPTRWIPPCRSRKRG